MGRCKTLVQQKEDHLIFMHSSANWDWAMDCSVVVFKAVVLSKGVSATTRIGKAKGVQTGQGVTQGEINGQSSSLTITQINKSVEDLLERELIAKSNELSREKPMAYGSVALTLRPQH